MNAMPEVRDSEALMFQVAEREAEILGLREELAQMKQALEQAHAALSTDAKFNSSAQVVVDLPKVDKSAPKKAPRDVFAYVIHEGKIRAPAGAMELIERVK